MDTAPLHAGELAHALASARQRYHERGDNLMEVVELRLALERRTLVERAKRNNADARAQRNADRAGVITP